MSALLQMQSISKTFPGVKALDNVSIDVAPDWFAPVLVALPPLAAA